MESIDGAASCSLRMAIPFGVFEAGDKETWRIDRALLFTGDNRLKDGNLPILFDHLAEERASIAKDGNPPIIDFFQRIMRRSRVIRYASYR